MRAMMGLAIGFAAFMAGCDSQPHEQMDSDFKALQTRCEAFRGQNEALKANVETLRAENASLERQRYGVRTENEALKRQLDAERTAAAQKMDKLVKELAAAKSSAPAAAATVAAPAGAARAASPASARDSPAGAAPAAGADQAAVAEQEKTVADLEGRIKALQPKLGQARSRIMAMARATVDQQMVAPPGGKIEGGQVYRREPYGTWPYDDYYYRYAPRYAPIGPAVKKGDFPSLREKEEAVRKLKEETLPMEQELKSLQDDLAAAKAKLAKLRTPPPSI